MFGWLDIVLLGIIEGITEFLPISSTAHLLIGGHWLTRQSDLFNIVIQSGAVIAVLPLFPERLRQFFFQWREKGVREYALKLFLAFAVTGVFGLVMDRYGYELPEKLWPVAWAMVVGGVLFLLIEWRMKGRPSRNEITWAVAVLVGVGQVLAAVFPGTSRSGATILLMLLLGVARPAATEFSFLVGIPTMLSAGGLKIFNALRHQVPGAPPEQWDAVLVGFLVSAVVSFLAVRWLLRYIQTHTFVVFGWYRILVGAAIFAMLIS